MFGLLLINVIIVDIGFIFWILELLNVLILIGVWIFICVLSFLIVLIVLDLLCDINLNLLFKDILVLCVVRLIIFFLGFCVGWMILVFIIDWIIFLFKLCGIWIFLGKICWFKL